MSSMKVDAMVSPKEMGGGPSLFCRFVIDADVPPADAVDADAKLKKVTLDALGRAESFAVESVGMIPLWSAPAAAERCARNMLQATVDFRSRARSLQRVVYCLFGKVSHDLFTRVLQELES